MATILSAEDEPDLAELISICLTVRGHQVTTVNNAEQALHQCRLLRPDLVIMDVVMPGRLDGLAAVRRIRANPNLAGVPVIVLSAKAATGDIEAGMQAGADVYMTKPFSVRDLASHVQALAASRRRTAATQTMAPAQPPGRHLKAGPPAPVLGPQSQRLTFGRPER